MFLQAFASGHKLLETALLGYFGMGLFSEIDSLEGEAEKLVLLHRTVIKTVLYARHHLRGAPEALLWESWNKIDCEIAYQTNLEAAVGLYILCLLSLL